MKDSEGNNISIGDRINFIWNFDNKIHPGEIIKIENNLIGIDILDIIEKRTSTTNNLKIRKIPNK